ncbi:MAG: hypothetical protein AVDCRST_MAG31-443 [uncultured Sphingomonas sp.]|uniref:Uncharacterized protein n=1 Tax=uncultured Sphingomonas sp. TaxID=158754 RepID=A0A6J4SKW3_9SPHN|nr:MAG: hypothetical protein AVDCRST_MAG31-443 [uncultured Sphingomonas sp.]
MVGDARSHGEEARRAIRVPQTGHSGGYNAEGAERDRFALPASAEFDNADRPNRPALDLRTPSRAVHEEAHAAPALGRG